MVLIPLKGEPREVAEGWLRTEKSSRELKEVAERRTRMDALVQRSMDCASLNRH